MTFTLFFNYLDMIIDVFLKKITHLIFSCNTVVTQDYETDLLKAFVIHGNDALLKCEIPSFVADFVSVESWIDNKHNQYFSSMNNNYGNFSDINIVYFIW